MWISIHFSWMHSPFRQRQNSCTYLLIRLWLKASPRSLSTWNFSFTKFDRNTNTNPKTFVCRRRQWHLTVAGIIQTRTNIICEPAKCERVSSVCSAHASNIFRVDTLVSIFCFTEPAMKVQLPPFSIYVRILCILFRLRCTVTIPLSWPLRIRDRWMVVVKNIMRYNGAAMCLNRI